MDGWMEPIIFPRDLSGQHSGSRTPHSFLSIHIRVTLFSDDGKRSLLLLTRDREFWVALGVSRCRRKALLNNSQPTKWLVLSNRISPFVNFKKHLSTTNNGFIREVIRLLWLRPCLEIRFALTVTLFEVNMVHSVIDYWRGSTCLAIEGEDRELNMCLKFALFMALAGVNACRWPRLLAKQVRCFKMEGNGPIFSWSFLRIEVQLLAICCFTRSSSTSPSSLLQQRRFLLLEMRSTPMTWNDMMKSWRRLPAIRSLTFTRRTQ